MLARFDEENLEVVIPEEVNDQNHNDWVLSEEEEQKIIDDFFAAKPE